MDNPLTTLVGEELEGCAYKWTSPLAAPNGFVYGIPANARRVVKFNPVDKSMTDIGPDFGTHGWKWWGGAITGSGIIYCSTPFNLNGGILKIDTNTDNVTELDFNLLPEEGEGGMWRSCALALDGCIYYMPSDARRIMKLDPNNSDTMSSVGDDLGRNGWKYSGTVVGIDGCVYGIPSRSKRIVKYDPINDITSFVGEEPEEDFGCRGDGVLGRDGCIYAVTKDGRILKIDTTNNSHGFSIPWLDHDEEDGWGVGGGGWNNPILGIDGCIYCPPIQAAQILKYDPHSNLTSLVGDDFGAHGQYKWSGGCTAPDGIIYCLPTSAKRVLTIDPLKEYTVSLKNNMKEHPEQLGCIFQPSRDIPDKTNFDRAVIKFGLNKVLEVLDECMPPADQACAESNLYPFMIAASYKSSNLSAIYHMLRQVPSLASASSIAATSYTTQSGKKRKQHSIS